MLNRVTVILAPDEAGALNKMCLQEVRPAKNFLRWLVVNEAVRRGILPENEKSRNAPCLTGERVATVQ